MNKKQLKQSITNRLKNFDNIINRLEEQAKKETSAQKRKIILNDLQFQKGFRHGLYVALTDLDFKITRKNKYLLEQ